MKFSVNWLRDFVDLPPSIDRLADLLTLAGVEIENVEQRRTNIDKVVVAQITASSPHPNADRLTVCEVEDGSGTKHRIVCGATNYKVGDKVLLALPGAKLPSGVEIRKSKLRGVESEGMLCSPIELGLGEEASGLLILSPDAKMGASIGDLFPADTILDVEITPNRGDLLSHFGLAREVAALTALSFRAPKAFGVAESAGKTQHTIAKFPDFVQDEKVVRISAPNECPFYSARKIANVKVGPSPQWLRTKIESVGIRAINNIVDISNFVMLEAGQPTHAFDVDKLHGGIQVRLARDGEKFLALDGRTYLLSPENLVIADEQSAVAIGGVMGGEETGVTESTRNILLESAWFLPASVRRTARNLNLPSDASYRFERAVDPAMVLRAAHRATELICEIAGGEPARETVVAGELPANPPDVSLSYKKCDQVLGHVIAPGTVDKILERFGLRKNKAKSRNGRATWSVPSYRRDLQRDVDLIEEVVRAYGVEKIRGTDRSRFTPASVTDESHDLESALRGRLIAIGLAEVRTSKLISRRSMASGESAIELRNPLSEDHVALRPGLLPGLLEVLDRNARAGAERVAVFELGRIFVPPSGKEERHLGILLWGNAAGSPHWRSGEKRSLDFFDLKGAIESLPVSSWSFRRSDHRDFSFAVEVLCGDAPVGFAGQVSSVRVSEVEAAGAILFAELQADVALHGLGVTKRFREIERFPAVTRDIAIIVPENLMHTEVLRVIEQPPEPLLQSVQLFDIFESAKGTTKSLAYRLTYRAKNRTLTNEEVTVAHAKIRERLKRELGVTLRE